MPLFEYVCADCSAEFEEIVPTYDASVECSQCGSLRVEKKLSVFAVAGDRSRGSTDEGSCGACGSDSPGVCGMS